MSGGRREGFGIVLGHGASGTAASMSPYVDGLRARGLTADAIDLRRGRAEDAVAGFWSAAEALGASRAEAGDGGRTGLVVGGQSFGGRVASLVAAERPAEVTDRAVPGHWEGDLILGSGGSAIVTLVERTSRLVILIRLPRGHGSEEVLGALARRIVTLPEQLRRSLTWDQGKEMAQHARFTVETGLQIYFCDPRSPWQRGTNENTNGLLRQYFPKFTSLAGITQRRLDAVAAELNGRPRQTLAWMSPSEKFAEAKRWSLDGTCVRLVQATEQIQERRFSAGAGTDDRHELPIGDVDRGALEGFDRTCPVVIGPADATDPQGGCLRLRHGFPASPPGTGGKNSLVANFSGSSRRSRTPISLSQAR